MPIAISQEGHGFSSTKIVVHTGGVPVGEATKAAGIRVTRPAAVVAGTPDVRHGRRSVVPDHSSP
jgi:hypothetical protein